MKLRTERNKVWAQVGGTTRLGDKLRLNQQSGSTDNPSKLKPSESAAKQKDLWRHVNYSTILRPFQISKKYFHTFINDDKESRFQSMFDQKYDVLIYNRVAKCGSTSTKFILEALATISKFTVLVPPTSKGPNEQNVSDTK